MTERIPAIQQQLEMVVGALGDLSAQVTIDEVTLRRTRRNAVLALAGLFLGIALIVPVVLGQLGANHNQDRISELQVQVQQKADRSRAAQCAVISLFLQFAPKTLASPTYTDEQHALQAQAYAVLTQIAKDLEC